VTSFFRCFFKTLSKERGIFGTVTSHFGIVESTTRMMLHLHGFAWLAGNFGAATLYQRLKSDPEFKDRIISYIRSIVRETVDMSVGEQYQQQTLSASVLAIPEDMTSAEFQEALDADSNNVAARVQMHTHSKTCTKYQRKG
jgi:S-formylglutathione hydrolase FrmB